MTYVIHFSVTAVLVSLCQPLMIFTIFSTEFNIGIGCLTGDGLETPMSICVWRLVNELKMAIHKTAWLNRKYCIVDFVWVIYGRVDTFEFAYT